MGLFADVRDWLSTQIQTVAGVSVTYARGAEQITITVTPGQVAMLAMVDGQAPARVELSDRDYLIDAADLTFGVPQVGDRITETIDGTELTFEIQRPDNGERAWRWSDTQRTRYRVHCKRTG